MKHSSALITSIVTGLTVVFPSAQAEPVVTRLNPPSALFAFGDHNPPIIARFATGQRFDLQATVQADPGKVINGGTFYVDNLAVAGPVSITPIGSIVSAWPCGRMPIPHLDPTRSAC